MTAVAPRVAAVIPCHADPQVPAVVERTLAHVDEVLLVDDDAPAEIRATLDALAGPRTGVLRRTGPPSKGDAVAEGTRALLAAERPAQLAMVLDADGQHPPEQIPAFVGAARGADIVVGDRRDDRAAMPRLRRAGNDAVSALLSVRAGQRMPDTQCGMRLFRARALERVPLPRGGFGAETEHLARAAAAGLRLAWVPIPAVYDGETSDFRPLRDSLSVLRAALPGG